jgi:hypothetical protein
VKIVEVPSGAHPSLEKAKPPTEINAPVAETPLMNSLLVIFISFPFSHLCMIYCITSRFSDQPCVEMELFASITDKYITLDIFLEAHPRIVAVG